MNMNPMMLMQLKGMLERFKENHPKIPMFLQAAAGSIQEGSVIEMSVTGPDGKKLNTNMRVTAEDIDLVQNLKGMMS